MEMIIQPSIPLLKVGVGCLTDCCVMDCSFCLKDCGYCDNCDDCLDCWLNFAG